MQTVAQEVAVALVKIGAVGFSPQKPITFKSGLVSPVYVDNRRLPFFPEQWQKVIRGFEVLSKTEAHDFDVIAGIETAGIPHSAALGYQLQKPSVFVRKAVKDHGTKKRVEGGDVTGKRVLLIEDHITTGGSSLSGVTALREAGAIVTHCFAITSYEFAEAHQSFAEAKVQLSTLTSFSVILETALQKESFDEAAKTTIEDWLKEPKGWAARHGF